MNTSPNDRRQLLHHSDALMEHVEQLRLGNRSRLPIELQQSLARVAEDVYGRESNRRPPTTPADAHRYLFAVQSRLLKAPIRTARQPIVTRRHGQGTETWMELELPAGEHDAAWWELAELRVERTLDRFQVVRGQAVAMARRGNRDHAARLWRKAEVAWANYWRLAEQLRRTDG
jgi:hypothetical protein